MPVPTGGGLVLQIIEDRRRGVLFTRCRLLPEEFDSKRSIAVPPNRTKACRDYIKEVNEHIIARSEEFLRIITELEACVKPFVPTDLAAACRRRFDLCVIRTFTLSLIEEPDGQGRHVTVRTYRATLAVFEKYRGHPHSRFEQLDADLPEGFGDYLKRVSIQRNTITFYLRILHTIYNMAKRAELSGNSGNPFEKVTLRMDKTSKPVLNPSVLRRIAEMDFSGHKHLEEARDLFLFCFQAQEMSFVVLAFLTRDTISERIIHYKRHRTGQLFSVRITPPFPCNDSSTNRPLRDMGHDAGQQPVMGDTYRDRRSRKKPPATKKEERSPHKKYLLSLSKCLENREEVFHRLEMERKLTFNVARNSWASRAKTKGILVAVISEGLGAPPKRRL